MKDKQYAAPFVIVAIFCGVLAGVGAGYAIGKRNGYAEGAASKQEAVSHVSKLANQSASGIDYYREQVQRLCEISEGRIASRHISAHETICIDYVTRID